MILAAGLTPAWQQTLSFREFSPGQVNRAQKATWCASGKVLNVGCALHFLGVSAKTLCLVGGISGNQIQADFTQLGIPVRWIQSQIPTRICTTILDTMTGTTTELVENSRAIPEAELSDFYDAFVEEVRSANVVVVSGSLPDGTPADFFRRLLERTTARTVLDIRGAELEHVLALSPFVVKPNRQELAKTVGRELASEDDLIAAMSELRHLGAEWVVVSQGPAPLIALGPVGVLRLQPPKVAVCNPIGCGDCLAAGIAAGIERNLSMRTALEIGIRTAAENAAEMLPARNLTRLL